MNQGLSKQRVKGVWLRKFPYPYRCALAICSDIDGTTREQFEEIHKFLNTRGNTPLGPGLGLEVGDSFWMYSVHPSADDSFTYFDGTSDRPSKDAPFIKAMVKAGYVDCLHSYGQFSQVSGFRREMALTAVKELAAQQMWLKVWVNHGDRHDFQNILGRYGLGDQPYDILDDGSRRPVLEYHTDVTIDYGIKFLWQGHLTDIVGQDRPCSIWEYYVLSNIARQPWHSVKSAVKLLLKKLLRRSLLPYNGNNALLTLITLRDGRKLYGFKRFSLPGRYSADDLAHLISKQNLEKLKANSGYMVVYVHLGKGKADGHLSQAARQALQHLAQNMASGNIFVTTTARLLSYNLAYHNLAWHVEASEGYINIVCDSLQDEVAGPHLPTVDELQGITFYTPHPARTRLSLGDRELEIQRNAADHTGRNSVTIPLVPLRYPETPGSEQQAGN